MLHYSPWPKIQNRNWGYIARPRFVTKLIVSHLACSPGVDKSYILHGFACYTIPFCLPLRKKSSKSYNKIPTPRYTYLPETFESMRDIVPLRWADALPCSMSLLICHASG